MRTQTDNSSNLFKEQYLCGSLAPDGLSKTLKAMEELDAPENIPEGLNPSVWERFCLVRRMKVESEQKVKLVFWYTTTLWSVQPSYETYLRTFTNHCVLCVVTVAVLCCTYYLTRPLQVKVKALTLAEMQAFLQKRRDEDKAAQQEIKNLSDELERYDCNVAVHSD